MWIQIVSILSILFQFFLPQIAFRNVLLNCGPWRLVLFLFDPIQSRSDQNDFSFQRTYPFDQVLLCESEAIELLQVMIFEVKLLGSLRQHVSILDLLDFNVIVFVTCVMRSQIVASRECFQRKLVCPGTGRLSTLLLICLHPGQCLDEVLLAQWARLAQFHHHFAL